MPTAFVDLVAHRAPMLLLDELLSCADGVATAVGRVREDCPFLTADGTLDPLTYVEHLAQAGAALEGAQERARGGEPLGGMLVGVRDFEVHAGARVGSSLRVTVRKGRSHEALKVASGEVWADEVRVAQGELRLFVDGREFPEGETRPPGAPHIHPLFPRWGERTEGMPGAMFRLDASFPALNGHFPGRPILPAVAVAMMAVETVRGSLDGAPPLRSLSYAKFSRPIVPGDRIAIVCLPGRGRPGAWTAEVSVGGAAAAALSFELSGDD
jgi:3-hydroxyacyl-[acyl-carrier-protein] dehydratase